MIQVNSLSVLIVVLVGLTQLFILIDSSPRASSLQGAAFTEQLLFVRCLTPGRT